MKTVFNEIPYDWLKPGTYVEARPNYANMGLVPFPSRALLIVQQLSGATAVPGKLYRITRADEATALFGSGSVGEQMVAAFKRNNKTTDLYALGLADAAVALAATGGFEFAGSGTGIIALYVGDTRITVLATASATPASLATAAAAEINRRPGLPVTAAADGSRVIVTARHKGECGNAILLSVYRRIDETIPAGLGVTISPMSGGAGNPDVQVALDAIANEWFTQIAIPWADAANQLAAAADLAERYKAMGKRDGHLFIGLSGSFGQLAAAGAVTNSPHISLIGGNALPTPPWAWAAALCGLAAFHLTNDPARQLRSLAMTGVMAPATHDIFIETEQELLLRAGISTFNVLPDGTVTLDRIVTTYKVSSLGVSDRAWLDIMVPATLTRIRYDWAAYVSLLYPRHKLADDDSAAAEGADAVVTPKRMLGSWAARCALYERNAWIERSKETLAQSRFYRSESDRNRLEGKQQIIIVGNLMVLAAALEFQV